jgi:diguanylate cyclase (GGDEF)-like protein
MLDARERSRVTSLDAARGEDDDQRPAVDPEKLRTDDPDSAHLLIEDRIFLREAMARLKTLERKVVHNFYYLDLNQTEIARKLGISVNYASYLLRGAIAKLKKAFEAQEYAASLEQEDRPSPPVSAYSISMRPAPTDPVTKVATDGCLVERADQEVMRASRYPQQFSVVLVEPDIGKLDAEALVELAKLLRANCRSIDLVARMGRTRFGLLLPHTGREASVLSERVCRMVASRLSCGHGPLTVSVGFAVFPTNGRTTEELLTMAEEALGEARRQGGNCSLRAERITPAKGRPQQAVG